MKEAPAEILNKSEHTSEPSVAFSVIGEGTKIALTTAILYACAFCFDFGYLYHFGIPYHFIRPTATMLLMAFINAIWLIMLFNFVGTGLMDMLNKFEGNFIDRLKEPKVVIILIALGALFVCFPITIYTIIIFAGLIAFFLLVILLSIAVQKHTEKNPDKDIPFIKHSFLDWLRENGYSRHTQMFIFMPFLFIYVGCVGLGFAGHHRKFDVTFIDSKPFALVHSYGDTYFLCPIKNHMVVTTQFSIINSSDKSLSFETVRIGRERYKQYKSFIELESLNKN